MTGFFAYHGAPGFGGAGVCGLLNRSFAANLPAPEKRERRSSTGAAFSVRRLRAPGLPARLLDRGR
jgi:hypothetical protein